MVDNPSKISTGEGAFLNENLNCCIFETESCRKLKFGEFGIQICQQFLKENRAKSVLT